MCAAAATRRRLLFCQNLGGQLPTRHLRPCLQLTFCTCKRTASLKILDPYSLKPHNRWLPIHVAAEQGHLDLCKYIIERIGHYNLTLKQIGSITTTFMSTPLHFASENGHLEICKLLIENMVHKNPATLDSDLWTPLHFAARFNHLSICRCVDIAKILRILACFFCFCAAFHRNFCSVGYRNFCSLTTEISVTHTTELSVKSSAKAEQTSLSLFILLSFNFHFIITSEVLTHVVRLQKFL